eukprot:1666962-Amphidinium_carterae.2
MESFSVLRTTEWFSESWSRRAANTANTRNVVQDLVRATSTQSQVAVSHPLRARVLVSKRVFHRRSFGDGLIQWFEREYPCC